MRQVSIQSLEFEPPALSSVLSPESLSALEPESLPLLLPPESPSATANMVRDDPTLSASSSTSIEAPSSSPPVSIMALSTKPPEQSQIAPNSQEDNNLTVYYDQPTAESVSTLEPESLPLLLPPSKEPID